MKNILKWLLVLGLGSLSVNATVKAQAVYFISQGGQGTQNFNFTTTKTGPAIVINYTQGTISDGGGNENYTLGDTIGIGATQIITNTQSGSVNHSTATYNATKQGSQNVGVGTFTLSINVSANSTGNATLILPNEPPSGVTAALNAINAQIASLQNQVTTDHNNIASLQSQLSALSNQLNAINTALTNRLTTDEATLATLQSDTNTNTSDIAALTSEITTIQDDISGLNSSIAALAAKEATDIQNLQNEINNIPGGGNTTPPTVTTINTTTAGPTTDVSGLQNQINQLKHNNNNQWMAIAGAGTVGAAGLALSSYLANDSGSSANSSSSGSVDVAPLAPASSQDKKEYNDTGTRIYNSKTASH